MSKVYKYGHNVDTDVIIPARHLNNPDPKSLASHCMEDIDADFASTVQPGDIVVGGANFGCGSSREHAPLSLKACGVKCVDQCRIDLQHRFTAGQHDIATGVARPPAFVDHRRERARMAGARPGVVRWRQLAGRARHH